MSYQTEKEEDRAFDSLSQQERMQYHEHLRQSHGNVEAALDATLGRTWFNRDGTPRGHRYVGKNDDEK